MRFQAQPSAASILVLVGLCAGLTACSSTGHIAARPESEPILPEPTSSSRVMTVSMDGLFTPTHDPILDGENNDDGWRLIESTADLQPKAKPAYTKKHDSDRFGPNLAASLYGSLMETNIPERSEQVGDQTYNARQVTFTGEGSDFDPTVSRDGKFIVYASTQHSPSADIYIKQANSRVLTRLTTDPGQDVMPAISPDGTRIAFASNRTGSWDIWVMPITGGKAIQVSTDTAHELHPTWSPDGKSIAYCRLGTTSGQWELWVSDPYDPMTSQFIGYGLFPEWSPVAGTGVNSSDKILFQRSRERGERTFGVWTLDYDARTNQAGHETQISSSPDFAYINPTWSPDGMWISYAVVPNPEKWIGSGANAAPPSASVWMIGLDGRGEMPLTSGNTVDLMPAWSTSGKVYFVSDRTGHENLWSVDIAPALLTAMGGSPFTDGDNSGLAGSIRKVNPNADNRDTFATVPTDNEP
ncbi:MAG: PD40 domain-containing protein [Phycisphaeraceae bacterium]|nr:MAG: PD40 domain-containing protein [Phycisphaeraceae bacterium]